MAKAQAIKLGSPEWNAFFKKEQPKQEVVKVDRDFKSVAKKAAPMVLAVLAGLTVALHGVEVHAFASPAVEAMANTGDDFADKLRQATEPVRHIIMAFGHEIYGVMMLWGGIEALIGKTQQGFTRMKASTVAYIVLVWVPWIVDTVNHAIPH